jgi:long-chain acyl-CoA synthetase
MRCRNLAELLQWQAERLGPRTALRYKRFGVWHDMSWERYRADASACAAALLEAGIKKGDRIGLLSENRIEWLVADMGILTAGAVNVPSHCPLAARQVQFQLSETEACLIFVSNREQLNKILQVRGELPALRKIIIFDNEKGTDATPWITFLQQGRQVQKKWAKELARLQATLGIEDLATIMYTSGTTGNPKGVMLTHGNLLSNAYASQDANRHEPDSILLSWLPYSHIYARTIDHYFSIVAGTTVCLAESPETVIQNIAEICPTHLTAVPRFYEKVLAAVATDDPAVTAKKLKYLFGPRIDYLSSGGAPLSQPVNQAIQAAGIRLFQGYGLTESSPVITFNRKSSNKLGTVGTAIPGIELKIAPDGEILTRGPHVMKGYWKNPEATAEAIQDGWLHTGDLGSIDAEGFLTITGRKKELLVLSNGKKVVPTFIEGLLVADDYIDQAFVCGEGRPYLTALIVPKWDNLRRALNANGSETDQPPEVLCKDDAVKSFLAKEIDKTLADVSPYEHVRRFAVLPDPFTVAGDELTVSLKLRRNVVGQKYRDRIESLYQENGD